PNAGNLILLIFMSMLSWAHLIMYPLFLGAVAKCFKERGYVHSSMTAVFMAGAFVGAVAIALVVHFIWVRNSPGKMPMFWVWQVFHWIANIAYACFLVVYVPLLFNIRSIID